MQIERFEDLIAWQKARIVVVDIYKIFKTCTDWSFRDQIQRAAVSIMNNIAEGFERRTAKELTSFFYIAKGSCGEVRSMLHLANDLSYINEQTKNSQIKNCEEISKIISGLIKSLSV